MAMDGQLRQVLEDVRYRLVTLDGNFISGDATIVRELGPDSELVSFTPIDRYAEIAARG